MRSSKAEWTAVALLVATCLLPSRAKAQTPDPESAVALERQGKLSDAERVWRAIVQQNPSDAAAFASLGVVLSKERKYDEAAAAYEKAIALNPALPGVQLNLGLAEFKQGHFQEAVAPFRAVLAV